MSVDQALRASSAITRGLETPTPETRRLDGLLHAAYALLIGCWPCYGSHGPSLAGSRTKTLGLIVGRGSPLPKVGLTHCCYLVHAARPR